MAKRGSSGICRVIGINKPVGMSSHDVVNRVRRIYGEKRVGHNGTLDPLASGVLIISVGPATRLNTYLVDHDKRYQMSLVFGTATSTDDKEGEVIQSAPIPDELFDPLFADNYISQLVGEHTQIPPRYSAIKVDGKKAYEAARSGKEIALAERAFTIYEAKLNSIDADKETGLLAWHTEFHVSKGTYMRSLARDIAQELGTCGHVGDLKRVAVSDVTLDECVSVEELEDNPLLGCLDPISLLGCAWARVPDESAVAHGGTYAASEIEVHQSKELAKNVLPYDNELVALVTDDTLRALYTYNKHTQQYKPACVFSQGVYCGSDIYR